MKFNMLHIYNDIINIQLPLFQNIHYYINM
jgi:hypothetical protein